MAMLSLDAELMSCDGWYDFAFVVGTAAKLLKFKSNSSYYKCADMACCNGAAGEL